MKVISLPYSFFLSFSSLPSPQFFSSQFFFTEELLKKKFEAFITWVRLQHFNDTDCLLDPDMLVAQTLTFLVFFSFILFFFFLFFHLTNFLLFRQSLQLSNQKS